MDILPFEQIPAAGRDVAGGKGASLARLIAAGLPVPPGFVVTTAAYRQRTTHGVGEAYRALGGGPVAVRSSATAEDGSDASFAGQQETYLGVVGESAIVDAIGRCWASLDSDRAKAYRRQQGIDDAGLAMAVVVQRLVDADVAGVLFTLDPDDADGTTMLVEAAWGLGEAVVSGRVTPDRFRVGRDDGAVVARHAGLKALRITAAGARAVPADEQTRLCLSDEQLAELAALGRRVEALDGAPRDIEWAWADGRFWLLQARPITAATAAERERVRWEEIAALAKRAEPGGTVWAKFNLAEVLPAPTPMTWAVVQTLLNVAGAFGRMYRDFGFEPDPDLGSDGVYDLVAGRPYCNLSREPRMYYGRLPFGHPFAELKADPAKAMYPAAKPLADRAGLGFWLRLPLTFWRIARSSRRMMAELRTFADHFRGTVLPAYLRDVESLEAMDFAALSTDDLLSRFGAWRERVLGEFARDSLKPTALAAFALQQLGGDATAAIGATPDEDADLPRALEALAVGRLTEADFRKRFGHRGPQEMELSSPRWSETGVLAAPVASVPPPLSTVASELAERLRTYVGLRETAKHHLMRGYALLRRMLLELDGRFRLRGGIFYLMPDELHLLADGRDFAKVIAERRRRRLVALSLPLPAVVFSDDLDAIGRPPAPVVGATTLTGIGLSAGVAEGPALVLREPGAVPTGERYVLVCPSTDPAWVPLFVGAAALVMETGGVLSHGAIVAREFGLPAVAGLPDATRQLRSGQRVRVDGGSGVVTVLEG